FWVVSPSNASGPPSVRSCEAADISSPDAPSVNVAPAMALVEVELIVTNPPGFKIFKPAQLASVASKVVLAALTVLSHVATSEFVGTTPPTQDVVRSKSSLLLAF